MAAERSTESQVFEDLIASAARGDRAAQGELLKHYWPVIRDAVHAVKYRMGPRLSAREETQDLQQAAAIKVLGALEDHEWRGRPAFAAWVRKLARAEVVDTHRHHAAAKRGAPELGGSEVDRLANLEASPESRVDVQARLGRLRADLDRLKPEYRSALMLHHMGYAHAQIGEILGCSQEAARKLVTRARTKLLSMKDDEPGSNR